MSVRFTTKGGQIWEAHASRALASASCDRELSLRQVTATGQPLKQRLFRRDAETSTRDACAIRTANGHSTMRSEPRSRYAYTRINDGFP